MSDPIVVIVLAAGLSRRLGRPKQLEPMAGEPLVVHIVRKALAASLDDVLVVVGAAGEKVRDALDGLPVSIVENPDFATGQASSLVTGVEYAQMHDADAVIVVLADQPGIDPVAIGALGSARRHGALIGMATYGDQHRHPVLFGRELFPELLELTGDTGGREVIHRHKAAMVLVPGGRSTVPADFDVDDDRTAVLAEIEAS